MTNKLFLTLLYVSAVLTHALVGMEENKSPMIEYLSFPSSRPGIQICTLLPNDTNQHTIATFLDTEEEKQGKRKEYLENYGRLTASLDCLSDNNFLRAKNLQTLHQYFLKGINFSKDKACVFNPANLLFDIFLHEGRITNLDVIMFLSQACLQAKIKYSTVPEQVTKALWTFKQLENNSTTVKVSLPQFLKFRIATLCINEDPCMLDIITGLQEKLNSYQRYHKDAFGKTPLEYLAVAFGSRKNGELDAWMYKQKGLKIFNSKEWEYNSVGLMREISVQLDAHEAKLVQEKQHTQKRQQYRQLCAQRAHRAKNNPPHSTREDRIKQEAIIKSGLIDNK